MRLRIAVAAVLAALGLAACSSSTNGTGSPGTAHNTGAATTSDFGSTAATPEPTDTALPTDAGTGSTDPGAAAFCAQLVEASTKLGDLGTASSDPAALKDAIQQEIAVFQDLDDSAPAEIKPAIHDLLTVLQAAAQALDNPTSGAATALSDLAQKLPADAQKIGEYVSTHCGG